MVREVTGHGAFPIAGGRAEEGKPRQPREQVVNPIDHETAGSSPSEPITKVEGPVPSTIQSAARELRYEVDDELNRVVVKILDKESGEVIRQIPAEELLRLAKVLEKTSCQLLNRHA